MGNEYYTRMFNDFFGYIFQRTGNRGNIRKYRKGFTRQGVNHEKTNLITFNKFNGLCLNSA